MSNEVGAYEQRSDLSVARDPVEVLAEAQKAAAALKGVIAKKSKPVIFNGEQYLEFEDWQTIGKFYGLTVKVVDTHPVQFGEVMGFEARAVVIHGPTGREISAAEAMCLNDEDKWSKRTKYEYQNGVKTAVGEVSVPLFQLKSMAQTRACAKAFRNVLAWVVVLAGYRPTPAEEMTGHEGKAEDKKASEPVNGPVMVKSVESKDGKKMVEGKEKKWTLYTITDTNQSVYTTFDEKIAEYARKAQSTGLPVMIVSEKDKYGYRIVEIGSPKPEAEKQAEREPGSDDK